MNNMRNSMYKKYIPVIVSGMQIIGLFFARKIFLLTVFQTVAAYALLCTVGLFLMLWAQKKQDRLWLQLCDAYLIVWSGIHGVVALGFMTCGTFYLTWTQVNFVQIVNLFLGIALFWFFFIALRRPDRAIGMGNLLIGVMGTLNFYLVKFRGAPFRLADIQSARTAGNVAVNYDFAPSTLLIVIIADLCVWYWMWQRFYVIREKECGKQRRINLFSVFGTIVVAGGFIALTVLRYDKIYANTSQFTEDTYLAGLLAEMMGSGAALPEDYSIAAVREIMESFGTESGWKKEGVETEEKPNIVVIMNEAFSDLRVLGNFDTNVPVLEFWDALSENTVRGWANVSVLGGNTANSEYEFLSSDAFALLPGVVPYNKYFTQADQYPSLVSVLKAQGYETTAFHPYLSSGWNRTSVYRAMGFDNIIFEEDLEKKLDTIRRYVSDQSDYAYIMEYFEEKEMGHPQFLFNVTMQNHGGYTYSGDDFKETVHLTGDAAGKYPEAEQYLSLMRESDIALRELLEYFENYEEPVVVVLFGDHQPKLEDGFYEYITGVPYASWGTEQKKYQYKTPLLIWHNYDTPSYDIGDISLNFLAPWLLNELGLELSDYQRYVLQQYKSIPVINSLELKEKPTNGTLNDYRLLIYNHTVDIENRVSCIYELFK